MNTLHEIVRRRFNGETLDQIAAALHVSVDWLEIVMSSDAYAVISHDYRRINVPPGDHSFDDIK